jgi:hypothetical protein
VVNSTQAILPELLLSIYTRTNNAHSEMNHDVGRNIIVICCAIVEPPDAGNVGITARTSQMKRKKLLHFLCKLNIRKW